MAALSTARSKHFRKSHLDPRNRYAFVNLQKLYEDQRQWADAAGVREKIAALDEDKPQANNQILGFLRNEVGEL